MAKIDIEQLELCCTMQRELSQLVKQVKQVVKPAITDTTLIPDMHAYMQQELQGVNKKYAIRAEVFIFVYLCNPTILLEPQTRCKTLSVVEKEMGLYKNGVKKYRKNLLFTYLQYKDFREMVDGLYEKVCEKFINA